MRRKENGGAFARRFVSMDCRVKPGNDDYGVMRRTSSPRNGYAVVAGGASLAVHLHRWASLEG
jgi:hypothetical protein